MSRRGTTTTFAKARIGLASDVHVTAVTTHMRGLIYFAQALKPGSVRGEPFGEMTWTGARLYQFDDDWSQPRNTLPLEAAD